MKRKSKPLLDADAGDASPSDPDDASDAEVRWLHLPQEFGVKPLKVTLSTGQQGEWSLVHWQNALQRLGGEKALCRTVDRNEPGWKGWHKKIHPSCPPPDVKRTVGVKNAYSAVTSLFVAMLCWAAGAARRTPSDRSKGALLLVGVLDVFFNHEEQPVLISIPRLCGGGLAYVTVKRGWVDATHWLQPEDDEIVEGFKKDFLAAAASVELAWASGHAHMCKLGVLICVLLVDPTLRRGETGIRYTAAACHIMCQVTILLELRMKSVTCAGVSIEDAKLTLPSGSLKRYNGDLKHALCQDVDDRKAPPIQIQNIHSVLRQISQDIDI